MELGILPSLTKDFILSKVTQEQIFEYYLGIPVQETHLVLAPPVIRTGDKNPTCGYRYNSNGKLRFKDFAGYFHGDCFDVIAYKLHLNANDKRSFGIILDTIARDFRLHKYAGKFEITTGSTYDIREVPKTNKRTKIQFTTKIREWNGLDARFWQQGNITKKHLDKYNIHPANYIWKDGDLLYTYNPHDPAYVYSFGNSNYCIYFPYRKKDSKYPRFLMNCSVLGGIDQLVPDRIGIITKSYKDVVSLSSFNLQAVANSSETTLIKESDWFRMKWTCEHWFSLMDYDFTGIKMAWKLRKTYGIKPLFFASNKRVKLAQHFPNYNIKDFFEFVTKFGKDETVKLIDNTISLFEEQFDTLDKYYYENLNFLKQNNICTPKTEVLL